MIGPLRTLRLVVEYEGTAYAGWQRQAPPNVTIQSLLEDAFAKITRERVAVLGAGRTDSGVHARAQVASLRTTSDIPLRKLLLGLNGVLPRDVAVRAVDEAPPGFDPRRAARGKLYRYRIWSSPARSAIWGRFAWHRHRPLDLEAIRTAAAHLVGEHDFTSFRSLSCDRKNPVRRIRRIELTWPERELLQIDIEGTAFLKNMCRIVVGTLVEVGEGARSPDDVAAALAALDRRRAGRTAPAHGLTLEEVYYEGWASASSGPPAV